MAKDIAYANEGKFKKFIRKVPRVNINHYLRISIKLWDSSSKDEKWGSFQIGKVFRPEGDAGMGFRLRPNRNVPSTGESQGFTVYPDERSHAMGDYCVLTIGTKKDGQSDDIAEAKALARTLIKRNY